MRFLKAALLVLLLLSLSRAVWQDTIKSTDGSDVTAYHYTVEFSQSSQYYHFYELEAPGVLLFQKEVRANKFLPWGSADSVEWLDECFQVSQTDDYNFEITLKPSCPTCGDFSNRGFLFWSSNKHYYYMIHPSVACEADYLVLLDKNRVGWSQVAGALDAFVQAKRSQGESIRVQDVGESKEGTDYAGAVRSALAGASSPSFALIVGDPSGSFPQPDSGDNAFGVAWLSRAPSFGRVPFDGEDASAFLYRLAAVSKLPRSPAYGIYDSCFGAPGWNPMDTGYCNPNCYLCKEALDVKNVLMRGAMSLVAAPNACWRPIATRATCDVTLLDPAFGNANLLYITAHGSKGGKKLATEVQGFSKLGRVAEIVAVSDLADLTVKPGMTVFSSSCYGGSMGSPSSTSIARELLREKKVTAFVGALGKTSATPAKRDLDYTDSIEDPRDCPDDCVYTAAYGYEYCTCYLTDSIPEGADDPAYAALKASLTGCKPVGEAVRSISRGAPNEGWVLYGDPSAKFSGCG